MGSAGDLDFGFFDFVGEAESVGAVGEAGVETGAVGSWDEDVEEVVVEVWNDDGRNRIFTTSARSPWQVEYIPFPTSPSSLYAFRIQHSTFCRSSFRNSGYNTFNSSE